MRGILVFWAVIALSAAAGCGDHSKPVWATAYYVEGEIVLPYAEVREPFQAWYNEMTGRSRIDYYGGTAKTFQFTDWPTKNGSKISIVPETTEQYLNKMTCFKNDGDSPGSTSPQTVLPDMANFKCAGDGEINGVLAQKWTSTVKNEQKTSKYTMWVQWRDEDGIPIPVPVLYEMIGYDTLMTSHFDHYYLSYKKFNTSSPQQEVWSLPFTMTCGGMPGPGKRHEVAIMNPIKEFINGDCSHHESEWDDFTQKHNKSYSTNNDRAFRKYLFKQNHRFIRSHNRAGHGYTLKINHLADRTGDELKILRGKTFSKQNSGNGGLPFPYSGKELVKKYKKLPKQHDWRLHGAVNPVKDQSICGSCWSFGTTGTIEGAYFVKNKKLISLSEQALVDCSWGYGNNGCDGGEDFRAYAWIMKHGGLPLEDEYGPYLAIDGMCHVDQVKLYAPIQGFINVTTRSEEALKVAIFEKGPISVSVDASPKTFSFYSNGVYYDSKCHTDAKHLDHLVLAVGYGLLDGKKYWLVKNSWSNWWGNDGYILISIKDNDCGVTTSPTYVILKYGSEEGKSKKRARAPVLQEPLDPPEQTLEERKGPLEQPSVPPGFLSPSVQQYLELGKSIPGRPGTDYPVLGIVPYTDFYCDEQDYPGFFADVDTRCQAWHYCDIDGRQATFLCPNGTQFSQAFFICDWWFNVRCDLSKDLYKINARLYQRPKVNPTRPHRVVTKEVLDNIFLRR